MNDNRSRDIFYGVVAVATLIVAIVGATLAYFSISVSSNEEAVSAKARTVQISYNDGQQISAAAENLIPASFAVASASYERAVEDDENYDDTKPLCLDDNNEEVCSIYRFTVGSAGVDDISIIASINNDYNGFTNLSYALKNVTDNAWIVMNKDTSNLYEKLNYCNNNDDNTDNDCYTTEGTTRVYNTGSEGTIVASKSLFGIETDLTYSKITFSGTKVFDLVIFLEDLEGPQNYEQGAEYKGTLHVSLADENSIIRGYIED